MQLPPALAVEWSDWVIRLPTSGGGAGAIFTILIIAVILYALVRGTSSVVEKVTGPLWSIVSFLFAVGILVAIGLAIRDDPDADPGVDCEAQLVDTCPPVGETGTP